MARQSLYITRGRQFWVGLKRKCLFQFSRKCEILRSFVHFDENFRKIIQSWAQHSCLARFLLSHTYFRENFRGNYQKQILLLTKIYHLIILFILASNFHKNAKTNMFFSKLNSKVYFAKQTWRGRTEGYPCWTGTEMKRECDPPAKKTSI